MSYIGTIVKKIYGEEIGSTVTANRARIPGLLINKGRLTFKEKLIRSLKNFFSNRRKLKWVIVIAAVLVLLGLLVESIFQYNRFSAWTTIINAKRANIDREMQRRANLMPNLVKVVNEYVVYEQRMFKYITDSGTYQLATSLQNSTLDLTNPLEKTLSRMLATVLHWPELKGTHSVQDLIKEAANTENRIADAKAEYNKACEVYNQYRTTFPGNIFGFIFGFKTVPYIGVGKEIMEVPDLNLRIPGTIIMPESGDVNSSASDPVSQMKADFLKKQFGSSYEAGSEPSKSGKPEGVKK